MKFSVIVPTCNRNSLLSECLDHLAPENQEIDVPYEVIITDDSKDSIAKSLIETKYKWAIWVPGPGKGPASNRNSGARYASAEWLVFVDDDCLPQKNLLPCYLEALRRNENTSVLEGKIIADRARKSFDEEAPINLDGDKLWSCNFAIKKALFAQLGGFDETFPYAAMEDVDFYTRVNIHSPIIFVPKAIVIHPWRRMRPFESFQRHLKSQKHFVKKHGLLNFNFRLNRAKIFAKGVFTDFIELAGFSMRGWLAYIEICLLNFCLIFI